MAETLEQAYLTGAAWEFRRLKKLADDAVDQVSDTDFFHRPDASSNSVALIVKHVAGNLRSRWTDFLTADGEKPDRHRDQEFEIAAGDTREALLHRWEEGWRRVFGTLESLTSADLEKTVFIRSEPHSVLEAIQRQLAHNAYHAGSDRLPVEASAGRRVEDPEHPPRRDGGVQRPDAGTVPGREAALPG